MHIKFTYLSHRTCKGSSTQHLKTDRDINKLQESSLLLSHVFYEPLIKLVKFRDDVKGGF